MTFSAWLLGKECRLCSNTVCLYPAEEKTALWRGGEVKQQVGSSKSAFGTNGLLWRCAVWGRPLLKSVKVGCASITSLVQN